MRITITLDARSEKRFLAVRSKCGFDFVPAAVVAKAFILDALTAEEKRLAKKVGKS